MYTRRRVIEILLYPLDAELEEVFDVEVALSKVRDLQRKLLVLFSHGYTVNEASKILLIQKPYRFFKNALRSVVYYLNGAGAAA